MPGFTVTRGYGPGATPSAVMARGFVKGAAQVLGGATRFVKKQLADLTEKFIISAMLISNNGKEYVKPIISSVQRVFDPNENVSVFAKQKNVKSRKSNQLSVSAKIVRVRKGNE